MSQGEAFQVGLRIGKYELTRKLGEGGFGVLFAARDTALDRELAIKFLHPHHSTNPDVVKRFVQEARSIAKVVHPGVVTVYESGEVWGTGTPADGAAFIIMELLQGDTLTQRVKNSGGRLAPATAMEICRQIASALEAAHRQGVVHRDLKPDNVMLVKDLALTIGERAKVLDFGIAKLATAAPSGATMAGMVFGTPNYMSPEQCRSAADANHSSDIYSLGCILFELVTGRTPFEGGMAELIAHHILTPPPIPSQIIPGLPPHIDDVVAAMLAKDPNNRPASMTVVEAILEERRLVPAQKSGARTRTLGGARLATNPPPIFGKPMAPGDRPQIPGVSVPDSGPVPSPQTAPAASAVPQTPAHGSPTTLSSAAGIAAKLERKSPAKWWIAIPIVAVVAVGTVLAVGRGGAPEPSAAPAQGSDIVTTAGSAETGSDTTTTAGNATTGTATTAAGSAATGSAGAASATPGTTTGSAGAASATPGTATGSVGSAASATGSTATTGSGGATPGTTTTGSTTGRATTAETTGTTTAGSTTGSAAPTKTTGTTTTGSTTGSAATTKSTGTTTGSAGITTTTGTTPPSGAKTTGTTSTGATTRTTGTTTKTTGTTTSTTGTTTKTTGTTTKTTGTTAGSASRPPKTTPPPGQGSAVKKCQGRSCILDGDF